MSKSISSFITSPKVVTVVALIVLAISSVAWWRLVYSNPTNVFDRMIANSLSSTSVSKSVVQNDDTQKLNQTTALVTAPEQKVRAESVLVQTVDADTSITTESISTPTADYVRYTDIQTSQTSASGKPFDFSSVLGIWGKTEEGDLESGGAQLFNQTVLGVVPVANVRQPFRNALLEEIRQDKVYDTDVSKVRRQIKNGRPVYSYDVSVAPVAYVRMLKNFARSIGVTRLEQVNPAQYQNSAPLEFVFDIDVWSGQLLKVSYTGSERTESYSGYGARTQIEIPQKSIDVSELQAKLQQIQ